MNDRRREHPDIHTKHLSVLPYDETRAALAHAITNQRGGAKSWLTRNRAKVHWTGEWASISYQTHTRVQLTIQLPDGDDGLHVQGSSGEGAGDPWQTAFDAALSRLLDTLAQRLVAAKREDDAHKLLTALGVE